MGDLRIGISGWTYAPWKGFFYPPKLPAKSELPYASRQFNSIEVNGTFYALQRPSSFQTWYAATPNDFCFSIKATRYITHILRLREIQGPLSNFFASGLLALKEKLGPILWQFPPSMKFSSELFTEFLESLPRTMREAAQLAHRHDSWMSARSYMDVDQNRPIRHAVEIRNKTFENAQFVDLLAKHDVALVTSDSPKDWPRMEEITSDFVYLRLHGSEEMYASSYSDEALDQWARKIRRWKARGDAFVYFDNDAKLHAPFDAATLARKLRGYLPEVEMPRHPRKQKETRKAA